MMRKHLFCRALAALLVWAAAIVCLSACQNKALPPSGVTEAPPQTAPNETLSAAGSVYRCDVTAATARDVLAGYTVKRISFEDHDKIKTSEFPMTPLASADRLEAFLDAARLNEYYVKEVMSIEKYDSDFFATYALVPVVITFAPSGSISYAVESAVLDGGRLTVAVAETIPACGTCDEASWLLLAEVKKADISDAESFDATVRTISLPRTGR